MASKHSVSLDICNNHIPVYVIHISLSRFQISDIKKALCTAEGSFFGFHISHIAKTPRFWHGVSAYLMPGSVLLS
ncbi:hypothetical protein, partial [Yersinia proxima]